MYYLISLCHTQKHEEYITLWRPNNTGYCFSKEMAGVYPEPLRGYHDSDTSMPITTEAADKLFITAEHEGKTVNVIPNNQTTWNALKVKPSKRGLVKL
jgi:hypothetical protein